MLRSWLGLAFFSYLLNLLPFADYWTTPFHPVPQRYLDSFLSILTSIVHLHAPFRIHRLTYLMPRFTYYCMYHTTPDLVPICLVVDRPLWTSLMYIRRPLLRKLGLKPDLVQS